MLRNFPVLARAICFLCIPALVCMFIVAKRLYSSVPTYNEKVSLPGLSGAVVIARDQHGIPLIQGSSDKDVFFAMGYAQAQDRLWQMDVLRRLAQGRLSEVFGPSTVNRDIWMRTLGLSLAAEKAWTHLDTNAQQSLEAYASGVNAWLAQGHHLPLEFSLFQYTPQAWSPIDSLALCKVFALSLGANYGRELERQLARQLLPVTHFNSLFPDVDTMPLAQMSSVDVASLISMLNIGQELKYQQFIGGKNVGSNAWVISGKLSQSGYPILANDPHLGLQIPSLWYPAKLKGDTLQANGVALVGVPIIVLGENGRIAWGATNLLADTQDLVSEHVDLQRPDRYLHHGKWLAFERREEVISIAPGFPAALKKLIKPITLNVRSTVNGPVISDVVNTPGQTLSLRWTALADDDTTFESLFKLNYATDWKSFRAALHFHVAPTLNILYADKQKNIGFSAAGKIPIRAESNGMVPATDAARWQGFISAADMPWKFNPESGFIVNANNKIIGNDASQFISNDWADPARAERIQQLLTIQSGANKKIDASYMAHMQKDVVDLNALRFIAALKTIVGDAQKNNLLRVLFDWNGDMHADTAAPALYISLIRQLKLGLYTDEFKRYQTTSAADAAIESIVSDIDVSVVVQTIMNHPFWCDNIKTEIIETCEKIIHYSLFNAQQELTKISGNSQENWRWKIINKKIYAHNPLSQNNIIRDFFERTATGDGTPDTISVAGYYFDDSMGYVQNYGASVRQVFELTPTTQHYIVNSTGQSGNALSEFYANTIALMDGDTLYALHASRKNTITVLSPTELNQPDQQNNGLDK